MSPTDCNKAKITTVWITLVLIVHILPDVHSAPIYKNAAFVRKTNHLRPRRQRPDLAGYHYNGQLGIDQYDHQPNTGINQYDYQPNIGINQYDYQPNTGFNQYDYQPNIGINQYDHQPNTGINQYDYQPNTGISQYDHQQNIGINQYDHQPNIGINQYDSQPNIINDKVETYHYFDQQPVDNQQQFGHYHGGSSFMHHALGHGFESPAQFEMLLTEDNRGDYMNYNNHDYDINGIHTPNDVHGINAANHQVHKHEHKQNSGNGIEMDVGTRDRVAHDPVELEAVAMRAIGHLHGQDELEYPDSSGQEHPDNSQRQIYPDAGQRYPVYHESEDRHYYNPYEEYVDPHDDPILYYK